MQQSLPPVGGLVIREEVQNGCATCKREKIVSPSSFFFFFSPGDHFHNVKKVKEKVIEKSVKSALPQIEYLKRSQIDRDTAQLFKS